VALDLVSTHRPLQLVSPDWQAQTPATQALPPAVHVWPHAPQSVVLV
jgi:hypothetical protein